MYSPVILSDEERLKQVLLNLQSNALKFTQRGKVVIRIEIEEKSTGNFIKVEVQDTGIGIPLDDQDKLFKLFGFIQSTQHCNVSGVGLGLNISKKIVTKLGGEITFKSVPHPQEGHGSTFSFTFKLEEAIGG